MANKNADRQRRRGYSKQLPNRPARRCEGTGKVCYDSRNQAAGQLHMLARNKIDNTRKSKEVLQIFRCAICDAYHLGHTRKKEK